MINFRFSFLNADSVNLMSAKLDEIGIFYTITHSYSRIENKYRYFFQCYSTLDEYVTFERYFHCKNKYMPITTCSEMPRNVKEAIKALPADKYESLMLKVKNNPETSIPVERGCE